MQTIVIADSKYKGLIGDILKEGAEYREIRGRYSFQTFLKKDMQLYRHCSQIVLQRSLIDEDDNLFVQLLRQLLMIYDKLKVVIIYPNADNSFIKSLLKLNVFNIASAADETTLLEELEKCLDPDGMDALEWIRQYPELVSTEPEEAKPQKKLILTKTRIASAAVFLILISTLLIAAITIDPKDNDTPPAGVKDVHTSDVRTTSVTKRKSVSFTTATTTANSTTKAETTTATSSESSKTAAAATTAAKTTATKKTTAKTSAMTSVSTAAATQPTYTQAPAPTTTAAPTATETLTTTTEEPEPTASTPKTTVKQTTAAPKTTTKKQTTAAAVRVNAIRLATDHAANNIILSTGQTSYARAVITPENAADKSVTWTSNRPDIAVVDGSGRITAISKGKAIITATTVDGGLSASCMVTVD